MTALNPNATTRSVQTRPHEIVARGPSLRVLVARSTFQPWTLCLLGLAIAVVLWGFGYKLSRYNPHPDTALRATVAKLWNKQQNPGVDTAPVSRSDAKNKLALAATAFLLVQAEDGGTPARPWAIASPPPSEPCRALLPLRSPPSVFDRA